MKSRSHNVGAADVRYRKPIFMLPKRIASSLSEGESETLEFKKSTGERRNAAESLCAMLNTRGGRIIIGVSPNGEAVGQQVSDTTIERLSNEFQLIEPQTFPNIDSIPIGDSKYVMRSS